MEEVSNIVDLDGSEYRVSYMIVDEHVYMISLVKSGNTVLSNKFKIVPFVAQFCKSILDKDKKAVLIYICDINEIWRRNKLISPANYRGQLFSCMFERYKEAEDVFMSKTTYGDFLLYSISKNSNDYYDVAKNRIWRYVEDCDDAK